MNVQAEVSLYPLRAAVIRSTVEDFVSDLKEFELETETGPMSTRVTGDLSNVFSGISNAFARVAAQCEVVIVLKVSNACPVDVAAGTEGTDA